MGVCPDRRILCLPRVAASLTALVIMRRVVLKTWPGVGPLLVTLAAFHPIVFFYAGAVRWYPFAFLADALRAWAIWCALAVWVVRRDALSRIIAAVYVVVTTLIVMATANHYLLDVAAGALTAGVSVTFALIWERRRRADRVVATP